MQDRRRELTSLESVVYKDLALFFALDIGGAGKVKYLFFMKAKYEHFCKVQLIYSCVLFQGSYANFNCPYCGYISVGNHGKPTGVTIFKQNFNGICIDKVNYLSDGEEMPKATLSYEALQLDSEGIPTEGAYKLKLEGNFKTHIEPIVQFIKATIPSSDRTYDPTTYVWAFHERFWPLMEQAFKGSHFQVQFTVRKEDFVELKRKQAEFAKQAGQSFQTKQYSIDEDINKFASLLSQASISATGYLDWTRQEAEKIWKRALRFFHPDLHPERAAQASELNEVWSRLKESYYIK